MLNKSHTAEFESATSPMNRMLPGLHGLRGILAARHALYTEARERKLGRWSGNTRNWTHISTVTLNPESD